jgi:peptidyl-prolyl cis-trans isomerase D
VLIPPADATELGTPDDAQLTEFYTANQRRYTAPEFRSVVWVALRPEDVAATVQVPDAAVAEEYAARRVEFTTPDTRGLSQLFFATEGEATAARQRIEQGVPFADAARPPAATPAPVPAAPAEAAAAAAANAPDPTSIGTVRREELDPAIAEVVFALEQGAVSPPLKSVFGWHIYKVNSVQRGGTKPLDEVREQLRADLAREQALAELYSLSVSLDDALAGGATLEVAAQRLGMTAFKETIDAQGRNRSAQAILNLPPFAQFLPTAFRTEKGRESRLIDAPEGGYFVVRVDDIIAPAPMPLEDIKERVRADWITDQRTKRTEAAAVAFLDKAKTNGDLLAYAAEAGVKADTTPPFTRSGLGLDVVNTVPPQLIGQMFTATVGEFGFAPTIAGGYTVARLKEIVAVEPAEAAEGLNTIRDELARNMSNDILTAYQTALREKYGIEINERALDQALTVATQGLPTTVPR